MVLNKKQTALHIIGSDVYFWKLMADTISKDCYESLVNQYNEVQDIVESGVTNGTSDDGEPIGIADYPTRKVPPIKHGFTE